MSTDSPSPTVDRLLGADATGAGVGDPTDTDTIERLRATCPELEGDLEGDNQ